MQVSPKPQARGPSPGEFAQRLVHITRAPLPDSLPCQFNGSRHRGMRRHAGQPAQLIGAEAEDVVEAGIGAAEVEGGVELALAAQYPRR